MHVAFQRLSHVLPETETVHPEHVADASVEAVLPCRWFGGGPGFGQTVFDAYAVPDK
jgi:hypothetical protein